MNILHFNTLKQKSKHLDIVNELALDLLHTSDLDGILWLVAKTAIANLNFEDCVVYLLDSDGKSLLQRAAHGPKNPFATNILNPIVITIGEGIVGQVAQTGRPEIIADTRQDARYIVDDEKRLSEISVPIFYGDDVIGVIDSEHSKAGFYTQEHLDIMTTIASMAATRIANAINSERLEALTQQLHHDASHDALTGLLNRREFERRLRKCLNSLNPSIQTHVLCFSDVNGFKKLNDTYGHAAGDEYLRKIARILKQKIGEEHVYARIGGDEFCILFKNLGIDKSRKICEEICEEISGSYSKRISDDEFLHISMGLYLLEQRELSVSEAMARADAACYTAKKNLNSTVCDYTEIRNHIATEKKEMSLIGWLRAAINSNNLRLFVQQIFPVSGVEDRHNFEVLLRLGDNAPAVGTISSVLRIAERHGLSTRLDYWVITQTLEWMHSQLEIIDQRVGYIAINLSAKSINNSSFQKFLLDYIKNSGIPAKRLCFEITENVAIEDIHKTAILIDQLRAMGCLVALDDFGSGLTSYDYLRYLSADILKIDGIFTRNAATNSTEAVMMSSINDLAHKLNMHTVAEHVEDEATFRLVDKMGIDFIQGFYLGVPTNIENLPQLINAAPTGEYS